MTNHHHSSMSGIPVRRRRRAVTKLRDAIDKAAEGLIELADAIDGDPDREPDADNEETGDKEPGLGSVDQTDQRHWAGGSDGDEEKGED